MLTRVDEFVGMLDMVSHNTVKLWMHCTVFCGFTIIFESYILIFCLQIRNDTSQIVNENLPQIQQKSIEMRQIYSRIDKLEVSWRCCTFLYGAFVVHISFTEWLCVQSMLWHDGNGNACILFTKDDSVTYFCCLNKISAGLYLAVGIGIMVTNLGRIKTTFYLKGPWRKPDLEIYWGDGSSSATFEQLLDKRLTIFEWINQSSNLNPIKQTRIDWRIQEVAAQTLQIPSDGGIARCEKLVVTYTARLPQYLFKGVNIW